MNHRVLLALTATSVILCALGCSSDAEPSGPSGALGGPVLAASDMHCAAVTPVSVEPEACTVPESPEGEGGASGERDGEGAGVGGADCNQTHDAEYGDTLSNTSGDDDDCKFHVAWSSTPIRLNQNVTFTVNASSLADSQPVQALSDGELPLSRVEVYQPCAPTRRGPTQNAHAKFVETAPGTYSAGPIEFDQPGRWVVRFHFYEQCLDGETSPHSHVAFFIDIP